MLLLHILILIGLIMVYSNDNWIAKGYKRYYDPKDADNEHKQPKCPTEPAPDESNLSDLPMPPNSNGKNQSCVR